MQTTNDDINIPYLKVETKTESLVLLRLDNLIHQKQRDYSNWYKSHREIFDKKYQYENEISVLEKAFKALEAHQPNQPEEK